jgi:hypothetical protein
LDGHEYIAVCPSAPSRTRIYSDPILGEYVVFGLN